MTASVGYAADVKPLINTYCAIAGCHIAPANGGVGNGDFTTYAGVKAKADNGMFNLRVYEQKGTGLAMPPPGSLLPSEAEYQVMKCWLLDGAKDN